MPELERPPAPVVVCDRCRQVAPLRMTGRDGRSIEGTERERELTTEGWVLTPRLDVCPRCQARERAADAVLAVACSGCGAQPGTPCRTPGGRRAPYPHRARHQLARDGHRDEL